MKALPARVRAKPAEYLDFAFASSRHRHWEVWTFKIAKINSVGAGGGNTGDTSGRPRRLVGLEDNTASPRAPLPLSLRSIPLHLSCLPRLLPVSLSPCLLLFPIHPHPLSRRLGMHCREQQYNIIHCCTLMSLLIVFDDVNLLWLLVMIVCCATI